MKTIALFSITGGVGRTTLLYHLAWMFQDLGLRVLVADLDPQANLTSLFLTDEQLEPVLAGRGPTTRWALQPLLDQRGELWQPPCVQVADARISLLPGDPGLGAIEERLSAAWRDGLADDEAVRADALRAMTAFHRVLQAAGAQVEADVALVDVGPSLGALNRAALIASDHVVIPVAADLFGLLGLENLGLALREWREGWRLRASPGRAPVLAQGPAGAMEPVGYVVLSHAARRDRPGAAAPRGVERVSEVYHRAVLAEQGPFASPAGEDPAAIATVRNYMSLMPLAHDARKPIFHLTAADGALGAHGQAVSRSREEFRSLAEKIASRCGVILPRDP